MLRRLLALPVAGFALLTATGCADDVSPALRVGDVTISNDEFMDEVDEWMGNPVAVDPSTLTTAAPGAHPGELVRQLLTQRIDIVLHNQEFDALGLELTDDLREQALEAVFQQAVQSGVSAEDAAEEAFAAFSDDFAEEYTDDIARQLAVQDELGQQGYSEWAAEAYDDVDIEVNSRYGRWDSTSRTIEPPSSASERTP